MTVVSTESDFCVHLRDLLDRVNDDDETVYVERTNNRGVAVISQEKLFWLERAVRAKEGSLESAAARDQLVRLHVLPDDEVVESNDHYWAEVEKLWAKVDKYWDQIDK